jgi:hypothetical protein
VLLGTSSASPNTIANSMHEARDTKLDVVSRFVELQKDFDTDDVGSKTYSYLLDPDREIPRR